MNYVCKVLRVLFTLRQIYSKTYKLQHFHEFIDKIFKNEMVK